MKATEDIEGIQDAREAKGAEGAMMVHVVPHSGECKSLSEQRP